MSPAREAALRAVTLVRKGKFMSEAVDEAVRAFKLDRRDAALCSRIVHEAVSNRGYIRSVLESRSKLPMNRLEYVVYDILVIGAAQLLFMDRIPPSAAVNEAVELCRKYEGERATSYVNGVLRRVAENRGEPPEIFKTVSGAEYLGFRYTLSRWIAEDFVRRRGYEGAEALCRANNAEPPLTIQVNTLKTSSAELAGALRAAGIEAAPGALPDSFDLPPSGLISALPGYDEGHFYVQDAAARLAVEAAALEKGMSVLDACSAPGGKSFAAAIRMGGEGSILACDLKEKRLKRVAEGAKRLGLEGMIECRAMDARTPGEELRGRFDVVIADAPCSGLGVIRRKPEIRYKTDYETASLPAIQLAILSGLAPCVKPGGTLLYSTCTLLERENEDVVRAFLAENEGFTAAEERTLWPDIDKTDGFFICRMVKSI